MRLDITGRHVTVTPALRQLITKRLATLERVLNDSAISALVIVTKEKYRHRVEMAIHTRGDHTLSGNAEDTSWPLAIRQASIKIEQQAKKLKGKWDSRKRQTAKVVRNRKVETAPETAESAPISTAPRVIKATRYAVKPMSVEDASLRLDEGDDDFLVFRDTEDDEVAVLYRRTDGNFGLIQP
ncbi:MAG: ribosome-associated translation inhibitor RaiA [Acidobacteriota bacterium]|nr:ribosome-associated translation inhibitor RaiA [Acidobacteriota bacterium]